MVHHADDQRARGRARHRQPPELNPVDLGADGQRRDRQLPGIHDDGLALDGLLNLREKKNNN